MAKQNTEKHTPLRQLRIPDDEWKALGVLVGDRERTKAVRELIRWKLRWPGEKTPERAKGVVTAPEEPTS